MSALPANPYRRTNRTTQTRRQRWHVPIAPLSAITLLCALVTPARADDCSDLASLSLDHAEIVSATTVAAGAFTPPGAGGRFGGFGAAAYAGLPAFCRVEVTSRPAPDSAIGIEVWLPITGWNGKLQAVGNGAWAGTISHSAMATALAAGYAAASTDTGHRGGSTDFLHNPDARLDFAERAVHELAVTAKALVAAFQERPAERAYFAGCSTGGRQALVAAQRYPDDFDGIVAGAPAYYPSHIQGMQVFTAAIANASDAGRLDRDAMNRINAAAIAACDTLDGVADGVIEDPRACRFDPAVLACPASGSAGNSGDSCLSPDRIETARRIYAGPTGADGASLYPGLAPGSESGWTTLAGDTPLALALETYQILVYDDPNWDWRGFDPARDIPTAVERIGPLMDANDADLTPFVEQGGRLLLYHGWSDPGIPPAGTIRYVDAVQAALGSGVADEAVRLFMVPGMGHCAGGTGTDRFDAVAALDRWIETGEAPERIHAERVVDGAVLRSRPLCAYPAFAVHSGNGSTDQAANFVCR